MSQIAEKKAKNILVTGAEGALGSAVVDRYREAGCTVLATYLNEPGPASAGVVWVQLDATQSSAVRAALAPVVDKYGPIDALVHCAGGFRYLPIEQTDDASLDFLINTNLRSAFFLVRELIASMKQRDFGRIVLISSRATFAAPAGMAAYAASKAGLNMLVSAVAEEVKPYDITLNAVAPSVIDTPANRRDMPQADPKTWVKRDELAEIIFALTHGPGRPIHGAVIPVSGRV